jgi:hypothetical protein
MLSAFKIRNKDALCKMSEAERRSNVLKQIQLAMRMPTVLIDEFQRQMAAPQMHGAKAANDPTHDQFRGVALKSFFGSDAERKFATEASNPILSNVTGLLTDWYNERQYFDTGYLPLFDLVDLRGTNQDSFKINTTSSGLTFAQRKPGEKALIRREFAEGEQTISFLEFAAGLGVLDVWLQYNQYYRVEELVNEFIAASFAKRGELFYGLITSQSTGIDEAFATDDATTFNNAGSTILQGLKNKGYALPDNPQFDILVDTKRVGRVLAMLEATRGSLTVAYGTQDQPIVWGVRNVIVSATLSVSGTGYYLVLPGKKLKRGEWKSLTVESQRDAAASATDWVGTEQYNGVLGEALQTRRVKFA